MRFTGTEVALIAFAAVVAGEILRAVVGRLAASNRHASAVIALDPAVSASPAEAAAVAAEAAERRQRLAERERESLARIAGRPATDAELARGRRRANRIRLEFPDMPDAELGRLMLHARWIVGYEDSTGANNTQVAHALGLIACELTELDRVKI